MIIHDVSMTLSPDFPVWPGDPAISFDQVMDMEKGDMCNVTRMELGVHSGTHVDAPRHFLKDGGTVEDL
ncbi:MAG: cyclase family protein, partial [Verrucomicrobiota bacterium]